MLQTQYASFMKRFAAFLVDSLLVGLVSGLLVVPLIVMVAAGGALSGVVRELDHWQRFPGNDAAEILGALFEGVPVMLLVTGAIVIGALKLIYFAAFESSAMQATPGKKMLGIFVTDDRGARISFLRGLGRTLGKVLSKMFCYLGYLLALLTPRTQALHDLIAGTLVLEPAQPAVAAPNVQPPSPPVPRASDMSPPEQDSGREEGKETQEEGGKDENDRTGE